MLEQTPLISFEHIWGCWWYPILIQSWKEWGSSLPWKSAISIFILWVNSSSGCWWNPTTGLLWRWWNALCYDRAKLYNIQPLYHLCFPPHLYLHLHFLLTLLHGVGHTSFNHELSILNEPIVLPSCQVSVRADPRLVLEIDFLFDRVRCVLVCSHGVGIIASSYGHGVMKNLFQRNFGTFRLRSKNGDKITAN